MLIERPIVKFFAGHAFFALDSALLPSFREPAFQEQAASNVIDNIAARFDGHIFFKQLFGTIGVLLKQLRILQDPISHQDSSQVNLTFDRISQGFSDMESIAILAHAIFADGLAGLTDLPKNLALATYQA